MTPAEPMGAIDRSGTVADYSDERILKYALLNFLQMPNRLRRINWDRVSRLTGMGSTYSAQLCKRFGINPDEVRR